MASQLDPEDYVRMACTLYNGAIPLHVPCARVSEVDHRTRRRSLSRRHVARMFDVPSMDGGCLLDKSYRKSLKRLGGKEVRVVRLGAAS